MLLTRIRLTMICVALSLLLYVVVTIFLPQKKCSVAVFLISIYKLLQIIGVVLIVLTVLTGVAYLLAMISLHNALDDSNTSVDLKRARKKFEKIVKLTWAFQCFCLISAGTCS